MQRSQYITITFTVYLLYYVQSSVFQVMLKLVFLRNEIL